MEAPKAVKKRKECKGCGREAPQNNAYCASCQRTRDQLPTGEFERATWWAFLRRKEQEDARPLWCDSGRKESF